MLILLMTFMYKQIVEMVKQVTGLVLIVLAHNVTQVMELQFYHHVIAWLGLMVLLIQVVIIQLLICLLTQLVVIA